MDKSIEQAQKIITAKISDFKTLHDGLEKSSRDALQYASRNTNMKFLFENGYVWVLITSWQQITQTLWRIA